MRPDAIRQVFGARFGNQPTLLVRAPGRVNLIGEHTDYNDGFVLPMAIDRNTWIALRARDDHRVVVYSINYDELRTIDLTAIEHTDAGWFEYVKGTAWALSEPGHALRGWQGVLGGDVPTGAGLSSSASVELAVQRAFAAVSDLQWDALAAARLGQRVENEWIGVNSGIMDQAVIASGVAGHALLIDCRSLAIEPVPLPAGHVVVVLDTATRRGLVDSAYNERRRQCDAAAHFFGVAALRDVDPATFALEADELDATTRARARHVIAENARTLDAARAMRTGDAVRLGQLMNESHQSLRDDFEVTNAALDTMVEIAQAQEACYGARMTGAGFGGCAVALVSEPGVTDFIESSIAAYRDATGLEPQAYACHAVDGASVVRAGASQR